MTGSKLLQYEFHAPRDFAQTEAQAISIARRRYTIAKRELCANGTSIYQAARMIVNHRLANPYASADAWRLMLNMAKRESARRKRVTA